MKTYKLHLIRHGLTKGNLDGIYMGGGLDLPLCQEGILQLENLLKQHKYPGALAVYSSPMLRATQSAQILYPNVAKRYILEDLRECNLGVFQGRPVKELANDPDFALWLDPKSQFVPKGGESGKNFAMRCANALLFMLEDMAKSGTTSAACISHGGVIMSMLGQLGLPRKPGTQWLTENGRGFTVQASAAMIMRDQMVEVACTVP